jgi:hypothetical protein
MNFKFEKQITNNFVSVNVQYIFTDRKWFAFNHATIARCTTKCNSEISFKKFKVMAFKVSPIPHEFKNDGKLPDHG